MKAVRYTQYGPPEVLQIVDIEKPTPADDQFLVKVQAVSLNPVESHPRRGMLLARGMSGEIFKPKPTLLGADYAGRVEAVGKNVTQFQPGDEVYGRKSEAGFAEYVCVSEKSVVKKPANISFEQAAGVPVAALTALQSIRDSAKIQAGHKVLINGAAGGLGTFGVQIAKAFGAHVTAVTSPRNLELARSLGADRVIDYTRQDFTREGQCYDRIIDNVGNKSASALLRSLNPGGISVVTGFTSIPLLLQNLVLGKLLSRFGDRQTGMMMAHITKEDLLVLNELMETGKVVPYVDKVYPLSQVAEAYRYLESHHARGKIVVTLE